MTSSISSCSNLLNSSKSFETTNPPVGMKFVKVAKRVVNARFDQHNRGGSKNNNIVDENMIVLRMRIKDMKLLEAGKSGAPSNWMGWEKKYFEHYNEDVCEIIGLLQMYLMETRPALALGMLGLIGLSVPFSTYFMVLQVMEMAKFIKVN